MVHMMHPPWQSTMIILKALHMYPLALKAPCTKHSKSYGADHCALHVGDNAPRFREHQILHTKHNCLLEALAKF
jgi:hypothetical protein